MTPLKRLGRFSLIMADPPWRFKVWSRATGLKKSADQHYTTMTLEQVKALPVAELAERHALLWLWCTWPCLAQGMDVMHAWGFTYKSGGAWHKKTTGGKTAFGTGYIFRSASEPFLVGTIGKPKTTNAVRNLVEDLIREHSRKPELAYAAAEQLMPDARRLELFARSRRPGWVSWGNEVDKFDGTCASRRIERGENRVSLT